MKIDDAIMNLKLLISYFEKYKEHGFTDAMEKAKEIASDLKIDPIFLERRKPRRKRQFDESEYEDISLSAEELFKVNYFLVVVDVDISSLNSRFEQLEAFRDIFGFLFDPKKLVMMEHNRLRECCSNIEAALTLNNKSDIIADELFYEL
ncbi:hypothetical protein ACOSP7_031904 [Xanthoceras sorbifolium]